MKNAFPPESVHQQREALTVSELNHQVRVLLEQGFALIRVTGEISNFTQPASGHWYFSLKDQKAQIRSAMFRGRNSKLRFLPTNGMQVLVCGRISLYEPRGDYQLIVEQLEEMGDGALRRAFEQLKQKLAKEGLFNPEHKQPLPTLPHTIGVITSSTGAAIRDILTVLRRRFPAISVIVYPTLVQGTHAAPAIIKSLKTAITHQQCDVLILARGGGSLEDLNAFNDEQLAREIYRCPIPIVTGIGHEIDFTIADFVSDVRGATPSAAAELVSPDQHAWFELLASQYQALQQKMMRILQSKAHQLVMLSKRLRHPRAQLEQHSQRLDDLERHLLAATRWLIHQHRVRLTELLNQLRQQSPIYQIKQYHQQLIAQHHRLMVAKNQCLQRYQQRLASLIRALEAISPLATLQRGYSIIQTYPEKTLVRRADQVKPGDKVQAQLGKGTLIAQVESIKKD